MDSADNLSISYFWFSDAFTTKFTDDATDNTVNVEVVVDGQESNKNTCEMAGGKFVSSGKPCFQHFGYINDIVDTDQAWREKLL